jgi:hypothetical protein
MIYMIALYMNTGGRKKALVYKDKNRGTLLLWSLSPLPYHHSSTHHPSYEQQLIGMGLDAKCLSVHLPISIYASYRLYTGIACMGNTLVSYFISPIIIYHIYYVLTVAEGLETRS